MLVYILPPTLFSTWVTTWQSFAIVWPPAISCAVRHLSVSISCLEILPSERAFGSSWSRKSAFRGIRKPSYVLGPILFGTVSAQIYRQRVGTFFDSVMHPLLHQSVGQASCFFGIGQDIKRQHKGQTPVTTRHFALQGRKRTTALPLARKDGESAVQDKPSRGVGLGDLLGPIGLSLGGDKDIEVRCCPCKAFHSCLVPVSA